MQSLAHYTKRIGLLGGMSPESTLGFYELLIKKHTAIFKDEAYPETVIFSVNFDRVLENQNENDTSLYVAELTRGIVALKDAGADFVLMASNTVHKVLPELQARVSIPILSIVIATLDQAKKQGLQKLLLLGTKQTMSGDFYQQQAKKYGIDLLVPILTEQDEIDTIIFDELNLGSTPTEASRHKFLEIIANYPADGIILGCTELQMIIDPEDAGVPLLDTLEIQVDQALREARG